MPRTAKPTRRDAFELADAYLHPGAVVVICAHTSRTWYEDRAFYTELLVWLEENQVKPVVIAPLAVHSALKVAAEFGTGTDLVLLEENTAAMEAHCEAATLGIAMPKRKSKDPITAGVAAQGLLSLGVPLLVRYDDGTTDLMDTPPAREESDAF